MALSFAKARLALQHSPLAVSNLHRYAVRNLVPDWRSMIDAMTHQQREEILCYLLCFDRMKIYLRSCNEHFASASISHDCSVSTSGGFGGALRKDREQRGEPGFEV